MALKYELILASASGVALRENLTPGANRGVARTSGLQIPFVIHVRAAPGHRHPGRLHYATEFC